MYVECEGRHSIPEHSGKYTAELGAVFAKACKAFVDGVDRKENADRPKTRLRELADQSDVVAAKGCPVIEAGGRGTHGKPQHLLLGEDRCVDLVGEMHRASPLQPSGSSLEPAADAPDWDPEPAPD